MHVRFMFGTQQNLKEMVLYLNESLPRRHFKSILGSANHLIITALVGLNGIERGLVTEAPEDLHTVWSPRDPRASALRSRRMILDMALVRAVDAVDVYVRFSHRKPALIQSADLHDSISNAGQSVSKKFSALTKHYSKLSPRLTAMLVVMIAWRNRCAHSEADIDIDDNHVSTLRQEKISISDDFRGLCVERLLAGFESGEPTFKEVASLIQATHLLIEELDRFQLVALDKEEFLRDLIWSSIGLKGEGAKAEETNRQKRVQSIWGKDLKERREVVRRFFLNIGLSDARKYSEVAVFDDDLIDRISSMSSKNMLEWLKSDRA